MDGKLLATVEESPAVPWTPEGVADPHPWFEQMLRGDRLYYDEASDIWCFFRYQDVHAFLLDTETWSLAKKLERIAPEKRYVRLLSADPPEHAAIRAIFSHAYRPRRVAGLEPRIRKLARDLIEGALERERIDVVAEIAEPLARNVIGMIMGVPEDEIEEVSKNALRNANGAMERTPDGRPKMAIWMGDRDPETDIEFDRYYRDLIRRRKADPKDDLVTDLAAADADEFGNVFHMGTLLDEQFGSGQNTTVHGVASMLALLDLHPDQQARVRQQPELVPSTIDETLRFWSPAQGRARIATREVPFGDAVIPEGALGLAWVQAANLDPNAFDDPDRFDVARSPNKHITFGYGEHYCMGASVARLEMKILLEEWLSLVGSYGRTTDGPLQWQPMYMLRGLDRFDIAVEAA